MSDKITTFPTIQPLALQSNGSFSPQGQGGGVGNDIEKKGFASQFTGDIFTSRGRFGNGTNFWDISATEMKTTNFVTGVSGCRIGYGGDVEFNDGTFRGTITALIGTFGSWTISGNSFATTNSNILIGTSAGAALTTGVNNTCIGFETGTLLTSASYGLFLGYQAGKLASPLAFYNTAIGYQAGYDTAGVQNLYLGFQAGYKCTGNWNVYLGSQAGSNDTNAYYNEGNYNIFIGLSSGTLNQTGDGNVFLGYRSGYVNVAGDSNVFLGFSSGYSNTGGAANFFAGYQAGYSNTVGDSSVMVGYQAGYSNTASNIICIGYQAGYNSTGLYNTFIGKASGFANTNGFSNSFYGYESGLSNTTADHNTFLGYQSGYTNIIGDYNTFVGSLAGKLNTATGNSFYGYASGTVNSTATQNSFFGTQSGQATTTGGTNSFFGWQAGYANIGGGSNCFYGSQAGNGTTTGNSNVFIGVQAGSVNTIGGQNVLIGLYADCSLNHIDNSIGIGTTATVTDDNQCVIGGESDGKVTNFYLGSGVTNTTPVATTVQSTGGRGTNIAGAALNIGGGKSTGNADGGAINLQISIAGASGTGLNGLTTKMIIDKNAQSVRTTDSPTFAGLGVGATIVFDAETQQILGAKATNFNRRRGILQIYDSTAMGAGVGGAISFGGQYDTTGPYYATWATIEGGKENGTNGQYGSYMAFYTRANGADLAERMRIDSAGNVGIGGTAVNKFYIIDGINELGIYPTTSTKSFSGNGSVISFNFTANGNTNADYARIEGNLTDGSAGKNEGVLSFLTAPSGAGNPDVVERMRIDSAGMIDFKALSYTATPTAGTGYVNIKVAGTTYKFLVAT